MSEEIKNCPFCDGEAEIITTEHKEINEECVGKYVQCKECECTTKEYLANQGCCCSPDEQKTEEYVIKLWNRRTCSCKKQEEL